MKKIVISAVCLILALALCACAGTTERQPKVHENIGIALEETTTVPPETTTEAPVNEFFNDQNNVYSQNDVTIRPRHLYWEGNVLVAQCFVLNGRNEQVRQINVKQMKFSNDEGVIADGQFGYMEDLTLNPQSYVLWTFYFNEDAVQMPNADLSSISWYSSISYSH